MTHNSIVSSFIKYAIFPHNIFSSKRHIITDQIYCNMYFETTTMFSHKLPRHDIGNLQPWRLILSGSSGWCFMETKFLLSR